jgi:hypothetical protein
MTDWELTTPEQRVTTTPPRRDVAAELIRALQNGDVALILTKSKLHALIQMLDGNWVTQEEFEILTDLQKLRDTTK